MLAGIVSQQHWFNPNLVGRERKSHRRERKKSRATENRRSATDFTPYSPHSALQYVCVFFVSANALWRTELRGCVICISVKQSSIAIICMRLIRHVTKALCSQAIIEISCGGLPGALHRTAFGTPWLVKKSHGCDFTGIVHLNSAFVYAYLCQSKPE